MKGEVLKFRKKDILLIGVISLLLLPSMMTTISPLTEAEHLPHVWKDQFIRGLWSVAAKANDDEGLHYGNVYNEVRDFFENCNSYSDFFYRIKQYVDAAKISNGGSDAGTSTNLSKIVHVAWSAKESNSKCKLWCYQHAILFAVGVKAMNSQWDEDRQRYVMWSTNDFKFKFWVGDNNQPNHVQLVIYEWKGNVLNHPIEVDTYAEDTPNEWHNEGRYVNSVMWSE